MSYAPMPNVLIVNNKSDDSDNKEKWIKIAGTIYGVCGILVFLYALKCTWKSGSKALKGGQYGLLILSFFLWPIYLLVLIVNNYKHPNWSYCKNLLK